MKPENEAKLAKIKKISGILQWICKAFLGFCVLGLLVSTWMLLISRAPMPKCEGCISYERHLWFNYNGVQFSLYDITDRDRVVVGILFGLTLGVMFYSGYQLNRLLGNYSRGEVFTTMSAGQIRKCGVACVLLGVMNLGWRLVPLIITSTYKNPGEGLSLVVIGLVIVAISWIMEMAAEMREEQELIV